MTSLPQHPPYTVGQVLDAAANKYGTKAALRYKRDGRWRDISWANYREQARLAARGFIKLGLEPKLGVSILGDNCPEWFYADIGAILAGGFPVGIYTTSVPEQCQYIIDHSDSAIIVVDNRQKLATIEQIRDQLPKLKAVVLIFGDPPTNEVLSWEQLLAIGQEVPESKLEARLTAQAAEDLCTLIYTSGTTAEPKAVMLSHDNFTWTAWAVTEAYLEVYERQHGDRNLKIEPISYLPLSHVAEQIVSLHIAMGSGGCTSFVESVDQLGENLREVRPTVFIGVPRVWEKIQAKIVATARQSSFLKRRLGAWARGKGLPGGYAQQRDEPLPALYGLAERLVFAKVREKLGLDRSFITVTSAAPASTETLEFFLSLGLPIYDIYGMSECTGPATISTPTKYCTGKSGVPIPGTEMMIAGDGEICIRGRHVFLGYYKDEQASAEALDNEGWLHSADIGELDDRGFLRVTGRKKDVIITSGGKNIAPQPIENELRGIAGISQAVVIGDRRKHLAALLTVDSEKIAVAAEQVGSPARDAAAAASCAEYNAFVEKEIAAINHHLARVQGIKKFKLLAEDFSVEGGELTATMKIKRRVVSKKYAAVIEALFT